MFCMFLARALAFSLDTTYILYTLEVCMNHAIINLIPRNLVLVKSECTLNKHSNSHENYN